MSGLEEELEEFLKRRLPLHERLSRLDGGEPPPELDRIVLDRAREAVRASRPAPFFHAPRWTLPTALAATVVLAFAALVYFAAQTPADGEASETASVQSVAETEPDGTPATGVTPGAIRPVRIAPSLATPAGPMTAPEAWLVRIERLRASGQTEEADRQLREFREAYPDYRPAVRGALSGTAPDVE